ncbi:MAG: hypothetical protein ACOC70_00700 [bacterium]
MSSKFRSVVWICTVLLGTQALAAGAEAPADEVLYLPDGEEVRDAVEARRGKTSLSKLAASMKPGTWAELKTDMPKGLWSAPSKKGLHIGTWSDDAHWDSRTGQFLFFGVRQARKFVAYSEEKNAWRVIDFAGKPNAPKLAQKFGHQYSCNGFDPERSQFYTGRYRYDIPTGRWKRLPPAQGRRKTMVWEYFSAMDALLSITRHAGVLWSYHSRNKKWTKMGKVPVHGYHSLARHNPYRKEVLFAGGNKSRAVIALQKDGTIRRLSDFPLPVAFTIRLDAVTVDPLSGRYLIMSRHGGHRFVEFDSEKDEYRLIDDFKETPWPFARYVAPIVAFIPEYGVTMWTGGKKVHLYKHDASADLKVLQSDEDDTEEDADDEAR